MTDFERLLAVLTHGGVEFIVNLERIAELEALWQEAAPDAESR